MADCSSWSKIWYVSMDVTPLISIWLDDAPWFVTGATERKALNLDSNPLCVLTTGCNDYIVDESSWAGAAMAHQCHPGRSAVGYAFGRGDEACALPTSRGYRMIPAEVTIAPRTPASQAHGSAPNRAFTAQIARASPCRMTTHPAPRRERPTSAARPGSAHSRAIDMLEAGRVVARDQVGISLQRGGAR